MPRKEVRTDRSGNRIEVNTYGPGDADPDGVIRLDVAGIVIEPGRRPRIEPQPQGDAD
jgi:hypothetical protein